MRRGNQEDPRGDRRQNSDDEAVSLKGELRRRMRICVMKGMLRQSGPEGRVTIRTVLRGGIQTATEGVYPASVTIVFTADRSAVP